MSSEFKLEGGLEQFFPPKYKPNETQIHVLAKLNKAILQDHKKFIIINAPTGSGKSLIAKTLANYSKNPSKEYIKLVKSYKIYDLEEPEERFRFGTAILTVTKALQHQYSTLFKDGEELRGKVNYPCAINEELTCETGVCFYEKNQKKGCCKNNCCPYYSQRNLAAINKCAFYNYALFNSLPCVIKQKDILVCDEASELEDEIVGFYSFDFNVEQFNKLDLMYPPTPNEGSKPGLYYYWLQKIQSVVLDEINNLQKELLEKDHRKKKKKTSKDDSMRMSILIQYRESLDRVLENWDAAKFCVTHTKKGMIFQPTEVDQLAQNLFNCANTVVLMSATIVDHKEFAKTLGIEDYFYIEAESSFDPKRAPIHFSDQYKLNYKNKEFVMPKIVTLIDELCKAHPDKKGIIHTHSMDVLDYIRSAKIDQSRFLYRTETSTNEDILEYHKSTNKPTILVSPSMSHGVDLIGKLGEFQIIVKAPYLPLGDKRIKKKFEINRTWYQNRMLSTLIQMCGRCNRIKSDYSETYVLDGTIFVSVQRNLDKLPKHFTDRFV